MGSQEIASTRFAGDANLVQYTRFEGNSTATVGGNGSDTGITYGTAYGKFGQGASLTNDATTSAASSCISLANSASLSPGTGNFSISLWYKTSDTRTGAHYFLTKYNSSATNNVYFLLEAETTKYIQAFFRDGEGDGVAMNSTKAYNDGNWHHIVSVRNGTTGYLYIDGILITSTTNASMSNINTDSAGSYLWLGTYSTGTSPGQRAQSFTGNIDDVSIFSRALTSDEIYSLYKTGVKKLNGQVNLNPELESASLRGDENLVQYTRFEGNSTATVGNNGTDTTITYGTAYGKHGQGAMFNGTSSKIVLADTGFPSGNGDRTICAWIKLDAIGAERCIFDYGSRANYQDISFEVLSTGKLWMDIYNEGKGGTTIMSAGVWNHVAVSYVGSTKTATFYVNGVADAPVTYVNALNTTLSTARIGCLQTDAHYFFNGSIDELSIFSRALTSTEISNLYNTNIKKYMGVSNV